MGKETVWMPIYIGDYLGDTQRLTTEQHGAYLLLLMDYWRNGPPPLDDEVLCSITGLKSSRFRKHKTTLLAFFKIDNGKLRHSRVDAEIIKAQQHAERRTDKARKAAEARWSGANDDAQGNAPSMPQALLTECPLPSHTFSNEKGGAAADPKSVIFADGLSLLTSTGSSAGSARSLLGKWCKSVGDDRVATLIGEARDKGVVDPRSWIAAAVARPANDQDALVASVLQRFGKQAAAAQ